MNALKRHQRENPEQAEVCIGDRRVDCQCDPELHRPVLLDPWLNSLGVHACLKCGLLTVTEVRGDDGRYTGNAHQASFKIPLPVEVIHWLGQFPRARHKWRDSLWPTAAEFVLRDVIYLPPDTRVQNANELQALEEAASDRQKDFPGKALKGLPLPEAPAPAGVPEALHGFDVVWRAARLDASSDLSRLIAFAQLRSPGSAIAVEILAARPDAREVLAQLLDSEDEDWRSAGLALARRLRPDDAGFVAFLIETMRGFSHEPMEDVPQRVCSFARYEVLLHVIANLKLARPELIEFLRQRRSEIAPRDSFLLDLFNIVLHVVAGEPLPVRDLDSHLP